MLTRTNKADDDNSDLYVGSTSRSFEIRLRGHWNDTQRPGNENNSLYKRMREAGLQNWEVLPLLSRVCDKKKTIYELEKKWTRILKAGLNTNSPITNRKEYYENNKDAIKQYNAFYRENNKDAIKQQKATYREKNKAVIKQQQAAYYKNNKNTFLQRNAEYYKNNKEAVWEYYRKNLETKRFYCEICDIACGSKKDLKHHLDTLKHSYAWLNSVD